MGGAALSPHTHLSRRAWSSSALLAAAWEVTFPLGRVSGPPGLPSGLAGYILCSPPTSLCHKARAISYKTIMSLENGQNAPNRVPAECENWHVERGAQAAPSTSSSNRANGRIPAGAQLSLLFSDLFPPLRLSGTHLP